jgi:hypothetical protein
MDELRMLYLITEVAPQVVKNNSGKRILTPEDLPLSIINPR